MSKNDKLLLKIGFVLISLLLLLLWLFFILENNILSFILALSFAILLLGSLRKYYIKLFEEDVFTGYLYLFLVIPIVIFAFIVDENNKIEKKEMAVAKKIFIKNKINSMLHA